MRDRAWRRYIEGLVVIRRINRLNYHSGWAYSHFYDVNHIKISYPRLSDFIGSYDNFTYKTHTTKSHVSKHKVKFSPNKSKPIWRNKGRQITREEQDKLFLNIIREYGIK